MIRKDLPENPQERKVIMLLSATDIMHLHSNKMEWIKSPNITVLEYPFDNDSPILKTELYKSLEKENLINPGAILSQSPYNLDAYADATAFEDLILSNAKEKLYAFSVFCGKLGAKKVKGKYKKSERDTTNKEIGGKVNAIIPATIPATLEADIKMYEDLENKLEQKMELDDFYPNPNTNIEAAKEYLDKKHIFNDLELRYLLEAREIGIGSRKVSFSLTSESKQSLKILGSIKYGPFNADGNYEKKCSKFTDFKVDLEVEFGNG